MLLGINAHINADLCRTLVALRYDRKEDFCKIDQVLEEMLPEIIRYLALHEHDVFAWGGLVFRQFFIDELHKIIIHWRKDAWENAHALTDENRPSWTKVHRATEAVGADLVSIFEDIYRARHLLSVLPELHALSIKI